MDCREMSCFSSLTGGSSESIHVEQALDVCEVGIPVQRKVGRAGNGSSVRTHTVPHCGPGQFLRALYASKHTLETLTWVIDSSASRWASAPPRSRRSYRLTA